MEKIIVDELYIWLKFFLKNLLKIFPKKGQMLWTNRDIFADWTNRGALETRHFRVSCWKNSSRYRILVGIGFRVTRDNPSRYPTLVRKILKILAFEVRTLSPGIRVSHLLNSNIMCHFRFPP